MGDYTARYRPWEGGILADAAWSYLLGNRAEAPANTLHLAPHLPNGWSWLEATGVRVGNARLNVRVERHGEAWQVKLSDLEGAESVTIHLTVPGSGEQPQCTVDDLPIPCLTEPSHWNGDDASSRAAVEVMAGSAYLLELSPSM